MVLSVVQGHDTGDIKLRMVSTTKTEGRGGAWNVWAVAYIVNSDMAHAENVYCQPVCPVL